MNAKPARRSILTWTLATSWRHRRGKIVDSRIGSEYSGRRLFDELNKSLCEMSQYLRSCFFGQISSRAWSVRAAITIQKPKEKYRWAKNQRNLRRSARAVQRFRDLIPIWSQK